MELREFREALGLSLDAAAEESGVSRISLWRFENGKSNPCGKVLVKLLRWAEDRRKKHRLPAHFQLDWEQLATLKPTKQSLGKGTGKRKTH